MKATPSIATQALLALLIIVISVLALSRIVELNVLALKLVLIAVVFAVVLAGFLLVAFQVLHMRVEEAVKTNEALLRLFIWHTPAAIAMFDTDMRYLQVSDRFLTDYHLEGQDIIGRSHYEVFPNLPERWKEVHRRILQGSVERCEEDPYVAPDGSDGWLQWESLPWRKGNGEIGGLILFTQVITSRKQAEEALRTSEERFFKIFNLSPFRMGILRARDGVVLEVNDSWIRDTGFTREEVINRPIFALAPWMGEGISEKVREIIQTRKPVIDLEVRLTTKDGREAIANTSAVLIELDNEPCYLWAANDITERKHAEEALKASENRFTIAFNSNPMLATISVARRRPLSRSQRQFYRDDRVFA